MLAVLSSIALGGWNILKLVGQVIASFLGKLDGRGWVELVCGIIAGLAIIHYASEARHWKKQDAQDVKALNIEKAQEASIAKQAVDLKARIDALTSNLTKLLREQTDAENASIAAAADAVRLRGPGKAACPGGPIPAAAPVRHDQTTPANADAGPEVPSGNWARVSWDWLVTVIEEHDQMRADLQATEDQHAQVEKAWPKGTQK